MKKLLHFSLITAAALYFGACGSSSEPTVLEETAVGTGQDVGLATQTGIEGVVEGTGVVEATTITTEDFEDIVDGGDVTTIETGKFLRAEEPVYKSLFFPADDGITGTELYSYDLTGNSILSIVDINKNTLDTNFPHSDPKFLTEVDGMIYFAANDGVNGRELWIYDSTTKTATIRNLNSSAYNPATGTPGNSNPRFITELNGKLYFAAKITQAEGRELCYYDIASNTWGYVTNHIGETMVPYDGTLTTFGVGSNPSFIMKQNGVLYFAGDDGTVGRELYRYNPVTDANTGPVLIANMIAGPGSSDPIFMAEINGKIFFRADSNVYGEELFMYDSATGVSDIVKDINLGIGDSYPMFMTEVDGVIYLTASATGSVFNWDLWKIDTTKVGNPTQLIGGTYGTAPRFLAEMDGKIYFSADDGTPAMGYELFSYDITSHEITSEDLAPTPGFSSEPMWMTEANGMLYFSASDLLNGRELWKSDGDNPSEIIGNYNDTLVQDFLPDLTYYGFGFPMWTYYGMIKTTW